MTAANRDLSHPSAAGARGLRARRQPAWPWRGAGGDWLRTIVQELRRIPLLLRHMRATCDLPALDALEPALLRRLGVRGLIWDVDGTLMRRGDRSVAAGPHAALARLVAEPALRHVILSNCGEARFLELAALFPALPLLRAYRTAAGGTVYRVRTGTEERWRGQAGRWGQFPPVAELVGARALRKPSPELVPFALSELGLDHPAHAAAIGDQRLTDVAGANVAGCLSLKVPTLGRESFPVPVRVLQWTEETVYRLCYRTRPAAAPPERASAEAA